MSTRHLLVAIMECGVAKDLHIACGSISDRWTTSPENTTCSACLDKWNADQVIEAVKSRAQVITCRYCACTFRARQGAGAPTAVCPSCSRPV